MFADVDMIVRKSVGGFVAVTLFMGMTDDR
jgi:hypothetical protein